MVTVLKFSLTLPDILKNKVSDLKEWLETGVSGKLIRWEILQNVSVESAASHLENQVINVEYERRSIPEEREIAHYMQFIYTFSLESFDRIADPLHRPWLSITDGKCFVRKRYILHSLEIDELSFGTLVSTSNYLCHHRVVPDDHALCKVEFFHDIRKLSIQCTLEKSYELIVDYIDIKLIIGNYQRSHESYTTILYLYLSNTPLVYTKRFARGDLRKVRCLTLSAMEIDVLGRSRVLCMKIISKDEQEGHSILSRLHARCNNMPINYANVVVHDKVPYSTPHIDLEHYGTTYIFQGILRRSYFVLECLNRLKDNNGAYISKLKEFARNDPDSLEKTLADLLQSIDDGKIFDVWKTTLGLYSWYTSNGKNFKGLFLIPPKMKLVRRIIITPTRKLYWPADIISGNRILRNFSADHAIRVTFRDDDYNRLPSTDCEPSVYHEAVKKPLFEGLAIGARKYEFLAWSNSQLREHSVWMYAEDCQKNTAFTIRSWMGKFSSIKLVGKYMARMGQCFSQTSDTVFVPLKENSVQTEDDIMDGFDPMTGRSYCFSDGIGKISESLAKEVCHILGLKKTYSTFQIRYAGYKGMLTVDPLMKDLNIIFRKSMLKFECPESTRLEIVKVSKSGPLQLNRPLITIMDQMGVPHTVFLEMQTEMLINMIEMFIDEHKASKYLSSHCSAPYLSFGDLCDASVILTTEPFFRSMLLAVYKRMTWGVKSKAMIDIDPSEGRNMFGVLDETRTLKYGQVFVQYTIDIYSSCTNSATHIHKGKVLVTKNPCLQPGDVRVLEAVDAPALHHIVDCIVFPQFGRRPHPDEMGGADLDGDEYTVIWKEELFFANDEPRHFPSHEQEQKALYLHRPITVGDMVTFLVDFIKNDQLGLIGTAHLVQADQKRLTHSICESIAEKYSVAVDFPKTGLKRVLADKEKPLQYPDFMQKKDKITYKSNNALGKLFRACQFMGNWGNAEKYSYKNIEVDNDLVYPGWELFYDIAEQSKHKYNEYLKALMQHYGVQHEAELISGCFTQIHGRHREYKQHRREVEQTLASSICTLWKTMRKDFLDEFMEVNSDDELDVSVVYSGLLRKASAWYMVTYNDKSTEYLSFPWIVADYLIKVKLEKTNLSPSCKSFGFSLSKLGNILRQDNIICQLPELDAETITVLNRNRLEIEEAIIHTSLQLIIKWACKMKIICEPNASHTPLNKMNIPSLMNIFVEAMHVNGILCKPNCTPSKMRENQELSPLLLCAYFFRFCILLRNLPESAVSIHFPFIRQHYKTLAKRCWPAYQHLVVSCSLKVFGLSVETDLQFDEEEMEPVLIDVTVFGKFTQSFAEQFAIYHLQCWSGVKDIQMRRLNNFYVITAAGPALNILVLQLILNKDTQWLTNAFSSGKIPEKEHIRINSLMKKGL